MISDSANAARWRSWSSRADRLAPVGVEEVGPAELLADGLQVGRGLVHVEPVQRLRLGELVVHPRRIAHRREALDLLGRRAERGLGEEARRFRLRRHHHGLRRGVGPGTRQVRPCVPLPPPPPQAPIDEQDAGRDPATNEARATLLRPDSLDCVHGNPPAANVSLQGQRTQQSCQQYFQGRMQSLPGRSGAKKWQTRARLTGGSNSRNDALRKAETELRDL